jgi:hypothetical protein
VSGGIVSGAAVRDRTPDDDDWGLVVRGVGLWPIIEATLQRAFDVFVSSPTIIYVGYAALGVPTAAAAWRIKRITFAGGNPTTLQWSGTTFTAVWDDRTIIPYS